MAMIYVRPFCPVGTTVSGTVGQTITLSRSGIGTQSIRILNDSDATASVQLLEVNPDNPDPYIGPVIFLLAGSVETFLLPNRVTSMEILTASGTVYVTTGESA